MISRKSAPDANDVRVIIDLPWPPSANRYWRNVAGRMVLSRDGRRYREAVAGLVWRHLCQEGEGVCFGESDLEVAIEAYPPDRRRRDLDNLLKPILDALQYAELFTDDSQVRAITIRFAVDERGHIKCRPGGRVTVNLYSPQISGPL